MTPVPEEEFWSSSAETDIEETTEEVPATEKKKRAPKRKLIAWNPAIGDPGFCDVKGASPYNKQSWVEALIDPSSAFPGPGEHGAAVNLRSNLIAAYENDGTFTLVLGLGSEWKLRHVAAVDVDNGVRQKNAKLREQTALMLFEGAVSAKAGTIVAAMDPKGKHPLWWFDPGNIIGACLKRLETTHGSEAFAKLKPKDFTVSVSGTFYGTTFMPRSIKVYCKHLLGPSEDTPAAPEGTCIWNKAKRSTGFAGTVAANFMEDKTHLLEAIRSLGRCMGLITTDFIDKVKDWGLEIDDALKVVANFHFVAPELPRKYWMHFFHNITCQKLIDLAANVNIPFTAKNFFQAAGLMQQTSSASAYDTNIECAKFFKTISGPVPLFRMNLASLTDALCLNFVAQDLEAEGEVMLFNDTVDPENSNDNDDYFPDVEALSLAVKAYVKEKSATVDQAKVKNISRFLTLLRKKIPDMCSLPEDTTLPAFEDKPAWKKIFATLMQDLGIEPKDFNSRVKELLNADFAKLVCDHLNPTIPPEDLFTDLSMFRKLVLLLAHHLIHEKAKNKSSPTVAKQPELIKETLGEIKGVSSGSDFGLELPDFGPAIRHVNASDDSSPRLFLTDNEGNDIQELPATKKQKTCPTQKPEGMGQDDGMEQVFDLSSDTKVSAAPQSSDHDFF